MPIFPTHWPRRIAATLFIALLWLWTGAKLVMDWVGRSTVVEDAGHARGLLEQAASWLFSTPWWVPAVLATGLTILLIFHILPREERGSIGQKTGSPATATPKPPTCHSYFKDKTVYVTDLFNRGDIISDFVFLECTIIGPAILILERALIAGSIDVDSNKTGCSPEFLVAYHPDVPKAKFIRSSIFRNCRFVDIGIAGDEDTVNHIGQIFSRPI